MNGYKAFFNGKSIDVRANTSYEAQQKAVAIFKPAKSKSHMVHVALCELADGQVIHVATN